MLLMDVRFEGVSISRVGIFYGSGTIIVNEASLLAGESGDRIRM